VERKKEIANNVSSNIVARRSGGGGQYLGEKTEQPFFKAQNSIYML